MAYQYAPDAVLNGSKVSASQSFAVVEDEIAGRRLARAATFSSYTASRNGALGKRDEGSVKAEPTVRDRRKARNVPRIFTGSFSQLEDDLRKMWVPKVDTPLLTDPTSDGNVRIRDFGATPTLSPCGTPSRSPSLQRREAVVSRETEIQERIIRGEVVSTRRPSVKERSRTLDNSADLEAWLREGISSSPRSPRPAHSQVPLRSLRHRENTL